MAEFDDLPEPLRSKRVREERIKERISRAVNLYRHDQGRDATTDLFDAIGLLLGYYRDYSETHKQITDRLDRIEAALEALRNDG